MEYMQVLWNEISQDPLGIGYAGMTDQEIADSLNAETREKLLGTTYGAQLYECIDPQEFQALSEVQKSYIRDILSLGGDIVVGPGSKARAVFLTIFGPSSSTVTNIVDVLTVIQSRGSEIGLGRVKPGYVQNARLLGE